MASFIHLLDQRRLIGPGGSTVQGSVAFYYTGTNVFAPIYEDASLTIPMDNPVNVAAGEPIPSIYLDTDIVYRRIITYSDGTYDETDPLGQLFTEQDIGLPIGAVIDFSGPTAPEGFLFCAGQAVSRSTYSALFDVIGTQYGSGNGTTTFNVPDYRGYVVAGKDNMGGAAAGRLTGAVDGTVLGATGGEGTHVLTGDEMPSHTHGFNAAVFSQPGVIPGGGALYTVSNQNLTTAATGGGLAHNNIQPTIVANKIIKVTATSFLSLLGQGLDFTGKANAIALGVQPTDANMGTYTGGLLTPNVSAKVNIQELATAALTVPAQAREVNPELPISTFMAGHELDVDHTPRFNEAIDALNMVTGQKGGTIRLDAFQYNVGSVQPITTGATWIKGVGATQSVANSAPQIADAKKYGSVINMLSGTGDLFTWGNQDGGSGYLFQGGGLEGLTTFSAPGRTGHVANVMRVRGWTAQDMNMWRPYRGIRTYGGLGTYLRDIYIDQLRGDYGILATGDALNKGDILDLDYVWIGAMDADTGTRGVGLIIRDYFHTVTGNVLRVVNPTYGIYADSSLATANDNMRPFVLRFKGTEVDFAQNEAVKLLHYRDAEFIGGYYHGLGTSTVFTADSHMVSGVNKNDELRIIGGKFSGAGNLGDLNLSGASSLVTGAAFHSPATANNNCIVIGGAAKKTKIIGNQIGEVGQSIKNGTMTGIRVFAGATKTDLNSNTFYNCDTAIVDSATAGQTIQSNNQAWGA